MTTREMYLRSGTDSEHSGIDADGISRRAAGVCRLTLLETRPLATEETP